jgi:D-alanyl-lipoteichoic acid acyltransferase DltB (MBOAT superfamily)
MLFNSYVFLFVYLPVVALGFYGLAKWSHLSAKVWLAIASIYFYAYWSPTYVVLLMGSIAINFCFSIGLLKLHRQHLRSQTKLLFVLALILNLTLLGYFKYANFFIGNAGTLLGRGWAQEWQLAQIVLPMGISFFTFTQIAFLVDTYQGKVREANPIHYLLFVTYFPHLIAGPILHHGQMMPQFAQSSIFKWNASNFSLGLTLFVFGLAKKVLLADSLLEGVTPTFQPNESESNLSTARAWIGALSYSLQLYFDFSGYSDMAMGLSLMFNVHLPLNFDSPYKARSIIDFWRRWHMTLSQFLRDYLYIALGGNRRGVLLGTLCFGVVCTESI